ncbi:MAG: hypothetical protein HRU23_01030 [Gammaproteobacteria bacterium]|nr:hypothetical protein [Gammaproteobacteria bacterium]
MEISNPTYIVAELEGKVADWILAVREEIEPCITNFPQEITITGSSGVGSVTVGQKLDYVISRLENLFEGIPAFSFKFRGINNFPNTDIYFVEPERELFEQLHHLLIGTEIAFDDNPFPYNPHCTLKAFTPLTLKDSQYLNSLQIPKGEHKISKVALYEKDGMIPKKIWEKGLSSHVAT